MLTFLELYQTLLGFVFFKLYTDAGLVYPPPLDTKKDESAAGIGAFSLQDAKVASKPSQAQGSNAVVMDGKRVSSKDVRQTIKNIQASPTDDADVEMDTTEADPAEEDEAFVPHPSSSNPSEPATLPTLQSLSSLSQSSSSKLFAPYTFWLSRESARPIFEFLVRSFGGRIGWPETSGAGSPIQEDDNTITHVIIDRPLVVKTSEAEEERERRRRRKYVQPQWVVDCINAGKILLEDTYAQGKTLPPHLSPFEAHEDAYDPTASIDMAEDASDEEVENVAEMDEDEVAGPEHAALKAAADAQDDAALHAAELEAEAAGVDYGSFEKAAKKATSGTKGKAISQDDAAEQDMNKMLMSNKQRKLYEKVKHSQNKRAQEVSCFSVRLFIITNFGTACDARNQETPFGEDKIKKSPLIGGMIYSMLTVHRCTRLSTARCIRTFPPIYASLLLFRRIPPDHFLSL